MRNIQEGLVLKKEDNINNLRGNQLPAALWSFTNIDKNFLKQYSNLKPLKLQIIMSKTTYMAPVETFTGKISSHSADGRITVSRRKCYGKDAKGRPFYGPGETYIYHCHKGEWSEGAKKNRTLFQEVQLLAKQELEDPKRVAYWQPLFEKQFKHPKQGEKHYATLRGFVIAQIHQQLKKQQAG